MNPLQPPIPPQMPQQQVPPESIQEAHAHFDDMQNMLKNLIKLPDSELNIHKLYEAASDLVEKSVMSSGKRGATAKEMALELSSPDFPKDSPTGEKPDAHTIRAYLLKHFNNFTHMQAAVTAHFAPPQGQING